MPPDNSTPQRFEQALAELERTLRELEDGTATLEESLARYERGVQLVRHCYAQLRNAEQKIKELKGLTDEGGPELVDFEHIAAMEKPKGPRGGRKRPSDDDIPY